MTISKTTQNFAKRRDLTLTVEDIDGKELLCVWEVDNDCEWICSFRPEQEKFEFHGNVYLSQECLSAIPSIITDEAQLRTVLVLIADSIKTKA